MRIKNFFQMNDWEIFKFIKIIIVIQLLFLSFVGFNLLGINIPILPQIINFLYLTFIPGIILLRVLKLHKLGNIETLIFAVGLSLFTLMISGIANNTFLPLIGIQDPLSTINLCISISLIVLILCLIAYFRDRTSTVTENLDLKELFSPPCLFICSIPFLVVIGTYLVNYYNNNLILLADIILIALIIVIAAFTNIIAVKHYPLVILSITISFLLQNTLISPYIFGWDVNQEYYFSNLVINNSYWNIKYLNPCNSMLSIIMLAPIYTKLCCIDLTWTIKLVYPLLFSFVPLALYRIVQKQTNDIIALLSSFFFISYFSFNTEMLSLCRQQIAELFLVLIILLFIKIEMTSLKRSILLVIFSFSLIVSHYGLSYIYLAIFICAWVLLIITDSPFNKIFFNKINSIFPPNIITIKSNSRRIITFTFLLVYFTILFAWYIYISGINFSNIVSIGNHISSSISSELFNPESVQGLNIIVSTNTVTPLHTLTKYVHLFSQFLIIIGFFYIVIFDRMAFKKDYLAFGFFNLCICFASISLPYFSSALNTSRVYQIALIILAPFAIIGGMVIIKMIHNGIQMIIKNNKKYVGGNYTIKIVTIFFVIYLLLNNGFIYEILKDNPASISISQESKNKYSSQASIAGFYQSVHLDNEIYSANWIGDHKVENAIVYADIPRIRSVLISYGMINSQLLSSITPIFSQNLEKNTYVYMGYYNIKYGLLDYATQQLPFNANSPYLQIYNIIYDNNGSKIYMY